MRQPGDEKKQRGGEEINHVHDESNQTNARWGFLGSGGQTNPNLVPKGAQQANKGGPEEPSKHGGGGKRVHTTFSKEEWAAEDGEKKGESNGKKEAQRGRKVLATSAGGGKGKRGKEKKLGL